MNKLFILSLCILISTGYLYADYRCKATLFEHVPVVKIEFNEVEGKEIDFRKGVPREQKIREQVFNPKLFDGDYSSLDFEVQSVNEKQGSVMYTKRVITRNELSISEKCIKENDKTCFYSIDNLTTNELSKPNGIVTAKSADEYLDREGSVTGSVIVVNIGHALVVVSSADKISVNASNPNDHPGSNNEHIEGYSRSYLPLNSEGFETFVYGKKYTNYNMHVAFEVSCEKK